MKLKLIIAGLFLFVLCIQNAIAQNSTVDQNSTTAQTRVIKIATLDWQPYVSKTSDNKGFTTEIITKAFQQSGYRVEIDFMP